MSNRLEDLNDETRMLCAAFLAACAREGILLRVTHTLRTYAEQDRLYAQGRTAPGPRVTAAPGGWSWHNHACAFDVCQQGPEPYPEDDEFWEKIGSLGENVGLEWGGRWKHPDRPHFQHVTMTLAQARAKHDQETNLA